jgi:hypothetical protein
LSVEWRIKKWNRGYAQPFNIVEKVSGNLSPVAKNLSGYSATIHIWDISSGTIISALCDLASAVGGQLTWTVASGAFSQSKKYWFEVELTNAANALIDTYTYSVIVEETAP